MSIEGSQPDAVLFDKDGTLIDVHATWGLALRIAINESASSEADAAAAFALMDYDRTNQRIAMTSPFVAESAATVNALLAPHLDLDRFANHLIEASVANVAAAPGVDQLLAKLMAQSVPIALVTNDDERAARLQMEALGWSDRFEQIIGADSGYGQKPEPGMVLHACAALQADPARSWIVGDSSHDLRAGRDAGCRTLLVTNGDPQSPEVRELADLVVDSFVEFTADRLAVTRV